MGSAVCVPVWHQWAVFRISWRAAWKRRCDIWCRSALRGSGAEREGFEPPEPRSSTVFKTAAIDHSAIFPWWQKYNLFMIYANMGGVCNASLLLDVLSYAYERHTCKCEYLVLLNDAGIVSCDIWGCLSDLGIPISRKNLDIPWKFIYFVWYMFFASHK